MLSVANKPIMLSIFIMSFIMSVVLLNVVLQRRRFKLKRNQVLNNEVNFDHQMSLGKNGDFVIPKIVHISESIFREINLGAATFCRLTHFRQTYL